LKQSDVLAHVWQLIPKLRASHSDCLPAKSVNEFLLINKSIANK